MCMLAASHLLSRLVHLDVGNNKLTLLPAELINLVNLKLLSIRDNAGLRELPPFGNYKCLESLRMRNVGKVRLVLFWGFLFLWGCAEFVGGGRCRRCLRICSLSSR